MKIKKLKTKNGKPRNLRGTVQYLLSSENLEHEEGFDELELDLDSESKGKRVLAKGSINTWDGDFEGGLKELNEIDREYKGRGDFVGHYMIAWRPGENPTNEQKLEAMQILLKNLGFADHPTIWVEHGDKPHPHVHLVVSRVSTESGPIRIGGSGASVQSESERNGLSRFRDNEELSCARAEAEICRDQGWEPTKNALFGPDLELIQRERDPDELKLRPRILDYEALHNKPHPARILGNTAIDILKSSNSWEEAHASLAKKGIVLDRVQKCPKSREGAILRSGRTSLKLSALPSDLSLKNLDIKWGRPLSDQNKPEPSVAAELALHVVAAKPLSETYSLQQIKNVLKKSVSNSICWEDFLNDLKRKNWSIERAGGGALIVARGHKLKFSQIPGKCSYAKLCQKFGQTLENSGLSDDLLNIVHYHDAISKTSESNTSETFVPKIQTPVVYNDGLSLPPWALEYEQNTGKVSKQRVLATEAQKIIRSSMRFDSSIQDTLDRLINAGIKIELKKFEGDHGKEYVSGLKLQKDGISILLNNLSPDCDRLSKIGQAFGERYNKPLPSENETKSNESGFMESDNDSNFSSFIKKAFAFLRANVAKSTFFHSTPRKRFVDLESSNNLSVAQKVSVIESQKAVIEALRQQQQQTQISEASHGTR